MRDSLVLRQTSPVDRAFQRMFLASPAPMVVLASAPQFTITEVNDAYLAATLTARTSLIGRSIFDAFPNNPGDSTADGLGRLRSSLERACATREPSAIQGHRYDIAGPDGAFVERWWDAVNTPVLDEQGAVEAILHHVTDITDRRHTEAALRASEERLRFLDVLAESTQPLLDATEIMAVTARLLGQHLGVAVSAYADMEPDQDGFTIRGDWAEAGASSIAGEYSLAGFGETAVRTLRAGRALVTRDTLAELGPDQAELFLKLGLKATVCMPLVKQGRLTALMAVHADCPRNWTEADLGLIEDTTERSWAHIERVRSEGALRESEARFRTALQIGTVGAFFFDMAGTLTDANDAFLAMSGFDRGDLEASALNWQNLTSPDWLEISQRAFTELKSKGATTPYEKQFVRRDGTCWWGLCAAKLLPNGTGFKFVVDVTDRKAAEARLQESEERLRLATEAAEIGFWDVDPVNDVLVWPPRVKAMFGISPDVPVTMRDFYDGIHPADREATSAAYSDAADTNRRAVYDVEYRTVGKEDRVVRWVAAKGRGVFEASGRCIRVVGTAIDITRRKADEARLRDFYDTLDKRVAEALAERKVFADVFEGTDAFIQVADLDFRLLAINNASANEFERVYGSRPKVGDSLLELLSHKSDHQAAVREMWGRALAGEEFTATAEYGEPARDQRFYEIKFNALHDSGGRLIGASQFVYDVTERQREQQRLQDAEDGLRQAQKMEAVGQLTGGVAHDFNNLLTIIKNATGLIRRPNLPPERREKYFDAISDTVDRAAKLTGQLLAFARRQTLKPEVFDTVERIQGITDMLSTIVGARIQIATEMECDPCFVSADASQFETALVNMVVNARDAMNGDGRLTIRVHEFSAVPPVWGQTQGPGKFVAISLTDTGHGIPSDQLTKIFEPFFTTKEVGKGTGLGLSQVFGFAKQSGGDVTVNSTVGYGTTFTLYLPRVDRGVEDSSSTEHVRHGAEHGRGRRVLVVEDNKEVGQFTTQILQDLGYETSWAANGSEALTLLEKNSYDVVFSDVVMPGMSGVELGKEIRSRFPGLPVVLTSGYSEVLADSGTRGFELIHKPYAAEELSRVLRRVTGHSRQH